MQLTEIFSSWIPVGLWAGLIFYLSSIPHLQSGLRWDFFLRKIAHMVEFGILALLLIRAIRRSWPTMSEARAVFVSAALAVGYAMLDEFHQMFVPGRGPSPKDVLIDACGIIIATAIYRYWMRRSVVI